MNEFYIILPRATTNKVKNPSFERDANNWTAVGGSIARSTAKSRRGSYSLKVTPTSTTTDGVYYGTVDAVSGLQTTSFDIWAANGVTMQVYIADTSGTPVSTPTTFTGNGDWQRIEHAYTDSGTNSRRIYITKDGHASTADFYLDAVQFEDGVQSTYCDGDQRGCKWGGAPHASVSSRSAQYRGGGVKTYLNDLGAYLISQQGTGMAPVSNQLTPYAVIDGSFFRKQTVNARSMTLTFSVAGDGYAGWHAQRKAIIDYIKSDKVAPPQPFTLGYVAGGTDVLIDCFYEDGFGITDGTQDIEAIPIKVIAPNPYWRRDYENSTALTTQRSISSANHLLQRDPDTAVWSLVGSGGPASDVYSMAYDPVHDVFYTYSADSPAFKSFDGSTWTDLTGGVTVTGGLPYHFLTVGADGTLYMNAWNGSVYFVAYWNGSAWAKLGGGNFNGQVNGVYLDVSTGYLYAWGNFTTAPGAVTVRNICYWNGSTWVDIGVVGTVLSTITDVIASDGYLYVTGSFLDINGGTGNANGLARYSPSANTWAPLGSGLAGGVSTSGFRWSKGLDGTLYLTGDFASVNGIPILNIAKYDGANFSALGAGLNQKMTAIAVDPTTGYVYQFGATASGAYSFIDCLGVWNGSSWNSATLNPPGSPTVTSGGLSILITPIGKIYVGYNTAGTAAQEGITTVTNNGSAKVYPKIKVVGPSSGSARITTIENITTQAVIYLDYTIRAGETIVLDLTPGNVSFISDFRGNIYSSIRNGSKMKDFYLLNGDNSFGFFASGSSISAFCIFTDQLWSVDNSKV